jgi:large subunit ribosomal protein L28e
LITKKSKTAQKPAAGSIKTTFGGNKSVRKSVNSVTKNGYRGDLRAGAVARASAIRASQKPVKEAPESKARGAKAAKAAAEKDA